MTAILSSDKNDLILEVMRAADPARSSAALRRLSFDDVRSQFSSTVADTEAKHISQGSNRLVGVNISLDVLPPHKISSQLTVGQSFESAILRPLLESVLASGPSNAYGSGLAGSSFRGLFAEQLASHLARAEGLGIAGMIDSRMSSQNSADGAGANAGGGRADNA